MKSSKNKTTAITTMILISTIALTMFAISPVNAAWDNDTAAAVAAGMKWDFTGAENYNASASRLLLWNRWKDKVPTWLFSVLSPNPVGVGQRISIVMFNPQQPPDANATNDKRYQYSVTIKKPDGNTETLPSTGTFTSDSTGTSYTLYTPAQLGNYTVTIKFHELLYRWYDSSWAKDFYGITLQESTYSKTLVVQQEPVIPISWSTVPLPTEYWTRPIEGTNTEWYRVSSNWLGNAKDADYGGSENRFQQDGIAPNSGHILWTKVTEDGGVVGGGNFSVPGEVFNAGHQYQTRFTDQIIMMGRLYYQLPVTWSGGGGGWMCVDLRTGEEIWYKTLGVSGTGTSNPIFGYYYDWDDMNQHGIVNPSWMFTNNFGASIHPRYGTYGQLNLTSVPSGFEVVGPKGEVLRYVLNNAGNTTNPDYRLVQWNSSQVFKAGTGSINASIFLSQNLDWNVSAPWRNNMTGGAANIVIRAVQYGDILLGSNGSHPIGTSGTRYDYPSPVTFWAVSLKPGQEGQLLWMTNIDTVTPDNNKLLLFTRAAEGVFVFVQTPHRKWVGYDMYTGKKLWEAAAPESDFNPFGYFSFPSLIHVESHSIAYGKLFTGGYTGAVHCYDLYNGTLLWRYEAPTNMEVFPYYTLMLGAIADGKIYVGTHEHSADTPLFKGNKVRCLNVTTGEEIWAMYGWAHPGTFAIADGILVYWNNYDHQVYAVGKGPSATTVEAPMAAITQGSSVVIRGTVTDISAGTKQKEQAARFPNGVPAVSDASMSNWMEYVYMQKPRPTNATGVEVTLDTIDPNGNWIHIGTATSDASGMFSYQWTPEVPGKYTVIATFAGTNSYWPSYAETAIGVDEAPAEPAAPEPAAPLPPYETYTIGTGIAIIIAVAIVGLMLLRKRP